MSLIFVWATLRFSATWSSRAGNEAQRFSSTTAPPANSVTPVPERDQRWKLGERVNATEQRAALVDAGWRVGLDGQWRSPNPNDARFSVKTLQAAWLIHQARQDQEDEPA
jgi:hypothetical protein